MTPIKQQVRIAKGEQTHFDYLIMFQFGDTCLFSRPFTIVSSTKQLSKDTRSQVRPRSGVTPQRPNSQQPQRFTKKGKSDINGHTPPLYNAVKSERALETFSKETAISPLIAIASSTLRSPITGPSNHQNSISSSKNNNHDMQMHSSSNSLLEAFGPLIASAEPIVSKTSVSVLTAQQKLQEVLREELQDAIEAGDAYQAAELAFQLAELTKKIKSSSPNLGSNASMQSISRSLSPTTISQQPINSNSLQALQPLLRASETISKKARPKAVKRKHNDEDEDYVEEHEQYTATVRNNNNRQRQIESEEDESEEEDPDDENDEHRHQLQMHYSSKLEQPLPLTEEQKSVLQDHSGGGNEANSNRAPHRLA